MPDQIVDGGGHGKRAHVSDENRLYVESKSRPSEELEAMTGDAFILHGECHLAAASSGGLMSFKNTSNVDDVIITRIYIDAHSLTPTDLIVTQVKEPTVSSGTDISTTGVVQKNFGSGKGLTGTLIISDGSADITLSGGTNYHSFPVQTMQQYIRDMTGTNVITANKTIAWGWKTRGGGNATNAEIISLSVNVIKRPIRER